MRNGRRLATYANNTTQKLPKKISCCRPISASFYNGGLLKKRWLQRKSCVRSFSKRKRLSRRSWKQKSRPCAPAHRRTMPHATTTHDTPTWRLVVGSYLAGWADAAVARLVLWGARRTGLVIPLSSSRCTPSERDILETCVC